MSNDRRQSNGVRQSDVLVGVALLLIAAFLLIWDFLSRKFQMIIPLNKLLLRYIHLNLILLRRKTQLLLNITKIMIMKL